MKDLRKRQSKARAGCIQFIRLKNMWRSHGSSRKTKLSLYKTLVVPAVADPDLELRREGRGWRGGGRS